MITTMTTTPPAMAATMIMLISSSSSSTTLSAVPTVLIFGLLEVILPAVVVAGALVVEFDVVSGTKQAWSVILTCLTIICIDWFKILSSEHSDLAYPANVTTKKPTSRSLHIVIMMCVIVKKIIILGQAEMRSFNLCSCASEHIYRSFFFSEQTWRTGLLWCTWHLWWIIETASGHIADRVTCCLPFRIHTLNLSSSCHWCVSWLWTFNSEPTIIIGETDNAVLSEHWEVASQFCD